MVRAPLHFHGRIPVPEVAPLTYRDSVTHLELVYELSEYLKKILHPSLQSTVDQVVADAERLLTEANAQYVDGVDEFQRIHDRFMSDVVGSLTALNDTAVTDLIDDPGSMLHGAISALMLSGADYIPITHYGYVQGQPSTHDRAFRDGVEDTSRRGKKLKLEENSSVQLTGGIQIPSNCHIMGSNASLYFASSNSEWLLYSSDAHDIVLENFTVLLDENLPRSQRGIGVTTSQNVVFRNLVLDAIVPETGVRADGNGLDARGNGLSMIEGENYVMENCMVRNWGHPYYVGHSRDVRLSNIYAEVYRTGLSLINVQDVLMEDSEFHTNDRSYVRQHGGMGVLLESTRGHDSTTRVTFRNVRMRDSASHGFRLGGHQRVSHVTFDHCEVSGTQRGGFKTLGGLSTGTNYHENITYHRCRVYDCGQEVGNASAFQIEMTNNVVVDNPLVANVEKPYSCGYGVEVQGSTNVTVLNPKISGSRYAGIGLIPSKGDLNDITIDGGQISTTLGNGIVVNGLNVGLRRLKILNHPTIQMSNTDRYAFVIQADTVNGVVSGNPVISAYLPYSGVRLLDRYGNTGTVTANIIGKKQDIDGHHFRNGSTWQDQSESTSGLYVKLHSAWHRLGE